MSQEQIAKIWDMIGDIKFAMLTSDDAGHLRSRPMAASQTTFEGTLWFFTRASSHKVAEVQHDSRVNVSYADPSKQNYVSLSGNASLVRDAASIAQHWSEATRAWFPKGKDDPDIALLKVDVAEAEYWDAPNSAMVHAYGYVKAVLTGSAPHPGGKRQGGLCRRVRRRSRSAAAARSGCAPGSQPPPASRSGRSSVAGWPARRAGSASSDSTAVAAVAAPPEMAPASASAETAAAGSTTCRFSWASG